ncbi:MAG: carboxypeptidase-like regulatory domain-containing protein [Cytophagaceae bacterium]|nr:carboxypeptidase-like regulatory domain-containing protein [Cytophagaceae bacterium]MDW8455951.1 carboxypeptidase-like regulatory domain-containing protein [Cytophagaceae bacterium]
MKTLKKAILTLACLAIIVSCKKNKGDDIFETGTTDLQVYVVDAANKTITGANVRIFESSADRDANTNPVKESATGEKGFAYFANLKQKIYYIRVSNSDGSKVALSSTQAPLKEKKQTSVTVTL